MDTPQKEQRNATLGIMIVMALAVLAFLLIRQHVWPWFWWADDFSFLRLLGLVLSIYVTYRLLKWLSWLLFWRWKRIKAMQKSLGIRESVALEDGKDFGFRAINAQDFEQFKRQVDFRQEHLKALADTGHHKLFDDSDHVVSKANRLKAGGSLYFKDLMYLNRLKRSHFSILRPIEKMGQPKTFLQKIF